MTTSGVARLLSPVVREGDFVGRVTNSGSFITIDLVRVSEVDEIGVQYEGPGGQVPVTEMATVYAEIVVCNSGCTTINFPHPLHCDFRGEYDGFAKALMAARLLAARVLGGLAQAEYE